MNSSAPRRPVGRIILIAVLSLSVAVLAVVVAVLVPILTHDNSGGSGQDVPTDYVNESSATGSDGRDRELRAGALGGGDLNLAALKPGDVVTVSGTGFDASIGIYVGFCAIPASPDQKPGPCLGGIPEGAEQGDAAGKEALSSAWISSDWAWRAFATQGYSDQESGSFDVELTVPEPAVEGLDCRKVRCAIVTRADHTALGDRVQDMILPIRYAD